MIPRSILRSASRTLALRSGSSIRGQPSLTVPPVRRRTYADDAASKPPLASIQASVRPSDRLPAASLSSRTPSLGETDASAEEVEVDNDEGAAMLRAAMTQGEIAMTEGGLTSQQEEALYDEGRIPPLAAEEEVLDMEVSDEGVDAESISPFGDGLKFPPPAGPLPPQSHLKHRYHPVLDQVTRLMMRDGKLGVAQRNMALILNYLRTSPAPIINPRYPLLPGSPPPSHLPLNPVLYLTLAIDSVGPLVRILKIKGAAGGGRALDCPLPLPVRQRRRQAWLWIMDSVNKRHSMGSGRKQFPHRIAEEIIAVVEGRSSIWEKRQLMHKMGTEARMNVAEYGRKRKGKK